MKQLFFTLLACTSLHANIPNWSLNNQEWGWNQLELAKTYYHHSEGQRQTAWDALSLYSFKGDEKVLDFGCGDGKITAVISKLTKKGHVVGVDLSPMMVEIASSLFPPPTYSNLEYVVSQSVNFSNWEGDRNFDLVTSFCCFHLVPDPKETLLNISSVMRKGATFVCNSAVAVCPAVITAAEKTFVEFDLPIPWKMGGGGEANPIRSVTDLTRALEYAGLDPVILDVNDRPGYYLDKQEYVSWCIGTLTANWGVPFEIKESFFEKYVDYYVEEDSTVMDEKGVVKVPMVMVNCLAKK